MSDSLKTVLSTLFLFAPFILLFFLINLSEKRRTPEDPAKGKEVGIVCYVLIVLGYTVTFFIGLIFHVFSQKWARIFATVFKNTGISSGSSLLLIHKMEWIGIGMWMPSLAGILLLIPAARRLLARLMPFDPVSRVHAVALSLSMIVFMYILTTLGIGLDVISESEGKATTEATLAGLWTQDLLLALLGMIGVGWLSRRSFRETLTRLGIVKPSGRQVLIGLGTAFALVAMETLFEFATRATQFGTDPNVDELTEKLLGPLFTSVPGILTLGLAAALGEETLFRGALLPRFGLFYSSVLFALVHANYGFSIATLVVFAVGICLGWIRKRHGTVTSMLVHATYNITLGILMSLTS
jgi:uncharacterized protein